MDYQLIINKLFELSHKANQLRDTIVMSRSGKISGIDLTEIQKTAFEDRGNALYDEIKVIISELDKEFGVQKKYALS